MALRPLPQFRGDRQIQSLEICLGFAAGFDVSSLSGLKAHSRTSPAQQLRKKEAGLMPLLKTPLWS